MSTSSAPRPDKAAPELRELPDLSSSELRGPATSLRPAALTDLAARVTEAVAALDQDALSASARRVAAATPGSRSAPAAEALARRWASAVRAWAADADAHGAGLDRSARDYLGTDRDIATAMRAVR